MNIGVQLYAFQKDTIRDELAEVLGELNAVGYQAVEGAPDHWVAYREILDELDLAYAAAHVMPPALAELDRVIDYVGAMGAADVCSSGPREWNARTYDDYRATCDVLNEKGRMLKQAGIALHYHNHEFEFLPVRDETTAMNVLLEYLDFSVVDLCLDAGWVWRAGVDPAAFISAHAKKIGYIHLRDFAGTDSVALGAGEMDLAPVISSMDGIPALRWLVVEHDPVSATPLQDLAASRAFLKDRFSL